MSGDQVQTDAKPESPSKWRLTQTDIALIAKLHAEPLLHGVEDNPVFRLILWKKRITPWWRQLAGFGPKIGSLLVPACCGMYFLTEDFWWLIPMGFGGALWRFAASALKRINPAIDNQALYLGIRKAELADLLEAGCKAEDFAQGAWGAACFQHAAGNKPFWNYVLLLLTIAAGCIFAPVGFGRFGLLSVLWFEAVFLFERTDLMGSGLADALGRHRPDADWHELGYLRGEYMFAGCMILIPVMLIIPYLISASTMLRLDQPGIMLWIQMLVAVILGLVLGFCFAKGRRRNVNDRRHDYRYGFTRLVGVLRQNFAEMKEEKRKRPDWLSSRIES